MSGIRTAALAALLACSALAGCRESQPKPCALYECDGACVDIRLDPSHCGACGRACLEGEVCSGGACATRCESPLAACWTAQVVRCTAVQSDPGNCGACGTTCRAGEVCSAGSCARSCEAPQVACGSGEGAWCADLSADRLNCGGCARACAPGQVCERGACVTHSGGDGPSCEASQVACGSGEGAWCADLSTDRLNCGGCARACAPGQVCRDGACAEACSAAGRVPCGGACVDLFSDDRHCGECGRACAATERCDGASCRDVCALSGLFRCGESCADLSTDAAHCGACGRACAAGATCRAGTCMGPICEGALSLSGRPNLLDSVSAKGLLAADFDGDGLTDLLVPEYQGGSRLLRGSKSGDFGAPEEALASAGWPMVAADMDKDGDLDVLVAEESALMLYEQKAGHFSPSRGFPSLQTRGVQVADFDGDGDLDVLAYADYAVDLWFSTPRMPDRNLESLFSIVAARSADLDGDGRPDLVAATYNNSGPVQVLMNQGDGAFGAPIKIDTHSSTDRLELADLDGDGLPDLIHSGFRRAAPYGPILGILRNVRGAFAPGQEMPLGWANMGQPLLAADLDGDARPEVILGEAGGHRVFPNQGDGSLGEPFFVPSATSRQLAAVDVQGDGRMDLVAATMETHAIEIRRQSAPGRYEGPDLLPIPADQVLFADLNGDGRDDLVTLVAAADAVPRGTIQVHLSGSKALVPLASLSGFGWGRVQAGDVDADGAIDLVVSSAAVPGVLLNRGDGTFRSEIPVLGMSSSALLADVTGDRIPDLVERSRFSGGLQVAIGIGNGAFSSPVETPTSTTLYGSFAMGDVDGDGRADAVVLDSSQSALHVFPGRSEGTFGPAVNLSFEILADWFSDSGLAVGDLDGDGRAEIAGLVSWNAGAAPRDHSALVIARDPLTSPSPVELISLTGSRDAVAIGSVTGRGAADLVVAGRGSVGVLATRDRGAFSPEERWSMPEETSKPVPVVGDLDGDLRADIVFPVRDHLVVFRGACLRP